MAAGTESIGQRQAHIGRDNRLRIRPRKQGRPKPTYKGPLYWWSGFEKYDGYGDIARNATQVAVKIADIKVQAFRFYHARLRNGYGLGGHLVDAERIIDGPQFSIQSVNSIQPPMGSRNAVYTMHEAELLDPAWVDAINRYDLVIVPCEANATQFRKQLRPPVEIVNLGLDHSLYRTCGKSAGSTYRFGTAGNIRHVRERKGMDRVIEWFLAAFPTNPDVSLSVKLNAPKKALAEHDSHPLGPEDAIFDDDPRIEIIRENMPHEKAAEWLRSIDCYVDASTYEGWGMWPFHAMATGRAVIGTYFGGHREYFEFENHIPIGYNITRALSHYRNYGNWAMPIAAEGIQAMRWAYNHPRQAREIGQRAAQSVKRFTWERFATEILQVLAKHKIYSGH